MKDDPKYVDACKIAKGLPPPKGNFVLAKKEAPKEEAKEEVKEETKETAKKEKAEKKPAKAMESAGISKEERDELEKLKQSIIKKKAELKAEGKSGGECNKDPEVTAMVARMQELKLKEDPSLADADKAKAEKKPNKKLSAEAE